ncbi:D-galactonate dehydratase [Streptomyces sp. SPB074]|uniref:D-galactonate dehydratase family member SSBG_02010 n=1 Tax=Streptomyces sp. (strain SPB074) TaxID=465543 RepID=IMAND_STRSH|nr:D-galactonate dehydratase [Streptomyces sp. SPB074]B5GCP6.1 RecName: Full=D-galactonate dehydratase family member SSBG_02010 [Streptomyces sp. SPB074]EDY44092.1 starvation sensing protein [Streptomyces sp. SPB074]
MASSAHSDSASSDAPAELPAEILAAAPWSAPADDSEHLRITAVRTFLTAPQGCPYVIVRVETNQPGLYGLGCASDPQRTLAIRSVVDDYYAPMLLGRDPADIEDLHRLLFNSGYWRGGSIGQNALAGVDVALWDIKGKVAGLPLHQLLGGRAREAAEAYTHVDGDNAGEIAEKVLAAHERGYRHVRVQVSVPGTDTYGTAPRDAAEARRRELRAGSWDSLAYLRHVPPVLREIRERVGTGVELLHDAHERLTPSQARELVHEVEDARLFFLEDALAPEDAAHFDQLRAAGSVPLAVGELYHDVMMYLPLLQRQVIDFARIRVPTLGGLTPTRKLVAAVELFGARTAPHGPGDVSPVGMAANLGLDLSSPAFGVQEAATFREPTREVFPGTPVPERGRFHGSDRPGLGVDFDEVAARKYPVPEPLRHDRWALLRNGDGSVQRP